MPMSEVLKKINDAEKIAQKISPELACSLHLERFARNRKGLTRIGSILISYAAHICQEKGSGAI